MLKPGLYELTSDVSNPSPDRRVSHDWRKLPTLKKGDRFIVEEEEIPTSAGSFKHTNIRPSVIDGYEWRWTYQDVGIKKPLGAALVAAFQEVTRPILVAEYLCKERTGRNFGRACELIFEQMIRDGMISVDHFLERAKAAVEREDKENP